MTLLKSMLYGLISGITEFLPISSSAHQVLTCYLLGMNSRDPFMDFLVHISMFLAVIIASRDSLFRLQHQQKFHTSRRKRRVVDGQSYYELRLLKTATVPLFIGLLFSAVTQKLENNLLFIFCFLILNAVILLGADHTTHGNKDARTMSGLDGIAMGLVGTLSVLPGISRTGVIASYATFRGADSHHAANWAVLLAIPALIFSGCFDLFNIIGSGLSFLSYSTMFRYFLVVVSAFSGGYIGISFFKFIVNRSGFSGFAYYSFGIAIFTFILYLIT